jgi:two-component system chemotaxis response regulator CheB
VVRGARENRWRPAIDPLFRSAAVSYRNRAIGVILTGLLDDGVAGLAAIKACGGTTIVQDPADAAYPDLPAHAVRNVKPDHCLPLCSIAAVLGQLVTDGPAAAPPVPTDIVAEARIAKQVLTGASRVDPIGERTEITCPDCGGVLWEVKTDGTCHYRCHTGHAFDPAVLFSAQSSEMEKTLWVALRLFEERRNLLVRMKESGGYFDAQSLDERVADTNSHIQRIRSLFGEMQ